MEEPREKFVVCPYYLGLNNKRQREISHIRCEGVSNGNTISLVFASTKRKADYKRMYCCSMTGMKRCQIYNMLNSKYGVKDG